MALPAVVAGSIFTFSLTLGHYILPRVIGSKQFIGKVVYDNVGVADNLPLAAAFARGPWRSWSSTSCSPGARVPSSRCDAVEAHALAPASGAALTLAFL